MTRRVDPLIYGTMGGEFPSDLEERYARLKQEGPGVPHGQRTQYIRGVV
jgi:hypothetical protein